MQTQKVSCWKFVIVPGLFAFLLALGLIVRASPSLVLPQQDILQDLENKIANFHFDAAEKLIPSLPTQMYQAYYKSNILIYKYLSTQNPKYFEQLDSEWEDAIEKIEDSSSEDSLQEIFLSDLYSKRAVIAFLDQSYFQAIRFARYAHKMIEESQEKYGDNIEQMKIRGLFNALLGAIPRKYQWISNTLGYKGNIQVAKQQLENAASKSSILRQEAMFILCYLEKNMLNDTEKALARIEQTRKETGPNILVDFMLASTYMNIKRNDKALKILEQRKKYRNSEVFFIPFWDYLLGKSHYYKESHPIAQIYFSQFLTAYKGKLFRSDAYFRLAMSLTLDGKYEAAKDLFGLIARGAKEGLDEDEYAMYMAKKFTHQAPNTRELALFRSRNLFDGGYLIQAISILKGLESQNSGTLSAKERTEIYYRYGRIYHTQGKVIYALKYYNQCEEEIQSDQTWQQAYSAYYSGEIMRNTNRNEEAVNYYKKALAYKDYFYQTGLESRCKIALGETKKELRTQSSASNR